MSDGYNFPKRSLNRLKGYDYSLSGAYFISIVIHQRIALSGNISTGKLRLNEAGEMIAEIWKDIPKRMENILIDKYIVMPNHFHGIVIIEELVVGADLVSARISGLGDENRVGTSPTPTKKFPKLGDVLREFKSITTNKYIEGVKQNKWEPFNRRLWQRNYHDRIIRNEKELHRVQEYIDMNPANRETDKENPINAPIE